MLNYNDCRLGEWDESIAMSDIERLRVERNVYIEALRAAADDYMKLELSSGVVVDMSVLDRIIYAQHLFDRWCKLGVEQVGRDIEESKDE